MRILRVVSDLYPSVVGGLGLHAHELSKAQAKLGHDVTVITSKVDNAPTFEKRDGYQIIRMRPICRPLGNAILPTLLTNLMGHVDEYDIIHAHSHLSFSTNVCAALRHMCRIPLVITNHGLISQTAPVGLQMLYLPTMAKWTFRSADKIICYTEEEKAELIKLGVSAPKIAVIHNGVDTKLFRPGCPNFQSKKLLWIGRYTPGKGVEYLIDAFAIFKEEHPGFSLQMIGRGPDKDIIVEKIRKLGLEDSIVMTDYVPNDGLPGVYRGARAFILPSLEEGVPRSILEAMACGIPVICTALPQLVEIVSGGGCLVPLRDPKSISEQLSQIVSDSGVSQRLGKVGFERIQADYSWDDTVARTLELYEQVIALEDRGCEPRSIENVDSNIETEIEAYSAFTQKTGSAKSDQWD